MIVGPCSADVETVTIKINKPGSVCQHRYGVSKREREHTNYKMHTLVIHCSHFAVFVINS